MAFGKAFRCYVVELGIIVFRRVLGILRDRKLLVQKLHGDIGNIFSWIAKRTLRPETIAIAFWNDSLLGGCDFGRGWIRESNFVISWMVVGDIARAKSRGD